MSEKKELNQEQLEKVTGGTNKVGDYTIYRTNDFSSIFNGCSVVVFSGNYTSTNFTIKENGKVTNKEFVSALNKTKITVTGSSTENYYDFWSDGTCSLGISVKNFWFGPKAANN